MWWSIYIYIVRWDSCFVTSILGYQYDEVQHNEVKEIKDEQRVNRFSFY